MENLFIEKGIQASNETLSEEGALKYTTTGNEFVDDFASISKYKEPRSYEDVSKTMQTLYSIDPIKAIKMILYIRLITRKTQIVTNGQVEVLETQRGTGLKHESIMRMLWLAKNHTPDFKENLPLFIVAGSWKDVFTLLLDMPSTMYEYMFSIIEAGLINSATTELVRKYLPTIQSKPTTERAKRRTYIGKQLAQFLFPNVGKFTAYKCYRHLKAAGIAHKWQQLISKQLYDKIDFNTIAGRALSLLVGSKFLRNHNLTEKYSAWIASKPEVKCTSFVFEVFTLLDKNDGESYVEDTVNAQFAQLVKTGKENINTNSRLLAVLDTSGSMQGRALGCNVSSYTIAKAMGIYFSEFLTGAFANTYAEFSRTCVLKKWEGDTPAQKWMENDLEDYGSTNFQSVIGLFIKLKEKGVPETDFPTGILCLSDGEFDGCYKHTNFETAILRLSEGGFSKEYVDNFRIILWDIPNTFYSTRPAPKFESSANDSNFFYLSGYDPSIVSFVLEGKSPKTAKELMEIALNQELLHRVAHVNLQTKH